MSVSGKKARGAHHHRGEIKSPIRSELKNSDSSRLQEFAVPVRQPFRWRWVKLMPAAEPATLSPISSGVAAAVAPSAAAMGSTSSFLWRHIASRSLGRDRCSSHAAGKTMLITYSEATREQDVDSMDFKYLLIVAFSVVHTHQFRHRQIRILARNV